jgi:hypothetical protein
MLVVVCLALLLLLPLPLLLPVMLVVGQLLPFPAPRLPRVI